MLCVAKRLRRLHAPRSNPPPRHRDQTETSPVPSDNLNRADSARISGRARRGQAVKWSALPLRLRAISAKPCPAPSSVGCWCDGWHMPAAPARRYRGAGRNENARTFRCGRSLVSCQPPQGQQGMPAPQQAARAEQQALTARMAASGEAAKAAVAEASSVTPASRMMRFILFLHW